MGVENLNNNEYSQERIKFFKKGDLYWILTEEGYYDTYVVSEELPVNSYQPIYWQFLETVSWLGSYGDIIEDNDLKIKMQELLIRHIDIISQRLDGFANLDVVKKYKLDILILKDKCLKFISDFWNWNEEDKEMINQYDMISNEIDELRKKMYNDEDLKDYQVVHLSVKNPEEINRYLKWTKEEHKSWKELESYQDSSSDENNQEIVTQSMKKECWKRLLTKRIKNFLISILNKTK